MDVKRFCLAYNLGCHGNVLRMTWEHSTNNITPPPPKKKACIVITESNDE